MKKETTEELMRYLLETIKSTVDFTKEQAPAIVEEILRYDAWDAGLSVLVTVTVSLVICIPGLIAYRKRESWGTEPMFATITIAAVMLSFLITITVTEIKTIVKIKTAPKYYLIQKLRGQ